MTAYRGQPIDSPVKAVAMALLTKAKQGQLVVCAGAGLSMADDACLPSGRALGEQLDARLTAHLAGYISPDDPGDLVKVADAAVDAAEDLSFLQNEVIKLADFDRAPANFGHRALALLLAEGAVASVLLWNWDDCIERSAPLGERIQVARTFADMSQLHAPRIAKIHGCATRAETLLISSSQLANPPLWAEAAFTAELRGSTGVFIGIGDVADYAQRRLKELNDDVPDLDVYVVSPTIGTGWSSSAWSLVVSELPMNRRVSCTADQFLDELARAWAFEMVDAVRAKAALLTGKAATGVEVLLAAFNCQCGNDAIRWCRASAFRHKTGKTVVHSNELEQAMLALGIMSGNVVGSVEILHDARIRLGDVVHEVLVTQETVNASQVRDEANRRAERLSGLNLVGQSATFLVAGPVIGPLNLPSEVDLIDGQVDPTDLVIGVRATEIQYINAADILGAAA
jgi:hypothetical protein